MSSAVEQAENAVPINDSLRPHPCQAFAVVGIDGINCDDNAQYVVDGEIALCGEHAEEMIDDE